MKNQPKGTNSTPHADTPRAGVRGRLAPAWGLCDVASDRRGLHFVTEGIATISPSDDPKRPAPASPDGRCLRVGTHSSFTVLFFFIT